MRGASPLSSGVRPRWPGARAAGWSLPPPHRRLSPLPESHLHQTVRGGGSGFCRLAVQDAASGPAQHAHADCRVTVWPGSCPCPVRQPSPPGTGQLLPHPAEPHRKDMHTRNGHFLSHLSQPAGSLVSGDGGRCSCWHLRICLFRFKKQKRKKKKQTEPIVLLVPFVLWVSASGPAPAPS